MAFPGGFLDELKSRLSIADVVGRKVMWDPRKSNPGKGDMWAPCPFHQEKTASFHVDDRKGFYYCFGCQAKGDMIGFVKETENVDFMEAVKMLAAEAGLPMPERDPHAQEAADKREGLAGVMEEAVKFCRLQLQTAKAAEARAYLERRGLDAETLQRFEIGFAPSDRTAMISALTGKGLNRDDIVEAGLAIAPDDGGAPFDRFRDRIMFPIRDARGRCIAFGGRAMSEDARAKYLNSPETPLFDKGRALYHHGPAREASGKSGRLIVAEGYMDVIALAKAGFAEAVAPLGTAITEDQLRMMWKIADEPIIALDGDKAGLRAARRLADLAMPMLTAGKSLRFALMPEGQDPDDVLRTQGSAAMTGLLDKAVPLISLLWDGIVEGRELDSPERRAKLDADLRAALQRIEDQSVRRHYEAEIRARRAALLRPPSRDQGRPWQPDGRGKNRPQPVQTAARTSHLARGTETERVAALHRETVILAIALAHPKLARDAEGALDSLSLIAEDHRMIRDSLFRGLEAALKTADPVLSLKEAIAADIGPAPLEKLFALGHIRTHPCRRADAEDLARVALADDINRHRAIVGHNAEVAEAAEALDDEGTTWRLLQSRNAQFAASRIPDPDDTSREVEAGPNLLDRLLSELGSKGPET